MKLYIIQTRTVDGRHFPVFDQNGSLSAWISNRRACQQWTRPEAFFDGIRQHKKSVADRRQKQYAGHNFNVGDIVTNSWGYDQTNVDWYLVKKTSKAYVWLKPIAAQLIPDEGSGPMSGYESISLDEHLEPIESDKPATKHQASGDYVSMSYGCGSKWTGQQKYSSWYA